MVFFVAPVMLISSFGCSYETADIEFGYTLSQARDKGNNLEAVPIDKKVL